MSAVQGMAHADSLADILERVLDRGVVIAGDVSISLVGIELVTIKLRLLIASVDKAKEMGIDWWTTDPMLSSRAEGLEADAAKLLEENRALKAQLAGVESRLAQLGV
jgi:hypothetical protein